jgi:CRP-like cAMP-binding protein
MLTVIEKVLQLQDLDLFEFVYTEHLAQLGSICRETELSKGTVLFRQGDTSKRLHMVVGGKVALEVKGEPVGSVEQGSLDVWSFLAERPHSVTAKALETTTLLTVTFEDLVDLLTAEAEFCWAITKKLASLGQEQSARIPLNLKGAER